MCAKNPSEQTVEARSPLLKKRQFANRRKLARETGACTKTDCSEVAALPVPTAAAAACALGDCATTYKEDVLAQFVNKHKALLKLRDDIWNRVEQTPICSILRRTTQPAHAVILLAVTTVCFFLFPLTNANGRNVAESPNLGSLIHLIYLSAFMVHFGSQFWMTFVSGLSLYFSVPRHTFCAVQRVLFPMYFSINSFLSLVNFVIFIKIHPTCTWDSFTTVQVVTLVVCFFDELIICLYCAPNLVKLLDQKMPVEKAVGLGEEIGRADFGPLKNCPDYMKMYQKFRRVHMQIAIGNMAAMACTGIHLYYLADKLCKLGV